MCVNIIKSVEQGIIDENLSNLNRVFALYSFYPSKKKCYFGGQMRDKMGDNMQISKLKINKTQKRLKFKCFKTFNLQNIIANSMLFIAKKHFPTQKLLSVNISVW